MNGPPIGHAPTLANKKRVVKPLAKHGRYLIWPLAAIRGFMAVPPSRTADKIMIRLPDGMRERLAQSAVSRGRSVNADVVARLEASFQADEEAYDSLQSTEELREFVNNRFDELEAKAQEQRLAFEHMMLEARNVLGDDLVDASLERARGAVRSKGPKAISPSSEKAKEILRSRPPKYDFGDSG